MGAVKRTHKAAREQEQYRKRTYRRLQAHPEEINLVICKMNEFITTMLPSVIEAFRELAKAAAALTQSAAEMAARATSRTEEEAVNPGDYFGK